MSQSSIRMVPRARLGLLLAGIVVGVVGFFMVGILGLALGVAVGFFLYSISAGWGVTLSDEALIIESILDRKIAWNQIQGIDYQISRLGTAATIIDQSGKKWILRAPATSPLAPDHEMLKKMTQIENFWKSHRGSTWQPDHLIQSALKEWKRTS